MISSYEGICNLIENDFKSFFDIELIENPNNNNYPQNKLFFSNVANKNYNNNMLINKKYKLCFNHESPGHPFLYKTEKWSSKEMFTENNFKLFKERYNNRINNFNNYIKDSIKNNKLIVFLLNTFNTPIKLKNILIKKYPLLKFKIVTNLIDDYNKKFFIDFQNFLSNKNDLDYDKSYDKNYKDEYILMNSFYNLNNINLLYI